MTVKIHKLLTNSLAMRLQAACLVLTLNDIRKPVEELNTTEV